MIPRLTQGPAVLVSRINQVIDTVNALTSFIGDGFIQITRTGGAYTIKLNKDAVVALFPKNRGLGLIPYKITNKSTGKFGRYYAKKCTLNTTTLVWDVAETESAVYVYYMAEIDLLGGLLGVTNTLNVGDIMVCTQTKVSNGSMILAGISPRYGFWHLETE